MAKAYALLVCLHCAQDFGDPLVMPFASSADRRDWWAAHAEGTGHAWYWINREEESLQPHEAGNQALDFMASGTEVRRRGSNV